MSEPVIKPLPYQRPPAGQSTSSISYRYKDDPIMVVAREQVTFEVEVEGRTATVEYGAHRHNGPGDSLTTRYRSEDFMSRDVERLQRDLVNAEADHQETRQRDKVRKAAAANPIPCLLLSVDGGTQRAHVRGVDLRSNKALVTLADGTKDSWTRDRVLRDLDAPDRRDLTLAHQRIIDTKADYAALMMTSASKVVAAVVADTEVIDLVIRYDVARHLRWAEVSHPLLPRSVYAGDSDEEIIGQIRRDLVATTRYNLVGVDGRHGNERQRLVPIADVTSLQVYDEVTDDPEHLDKIRAAEAAQEQAKAALAALVEDCLLDLSPFDGVVAEAREAGAGAAEEVEHGADLAASIRAAKAPQEVPEWD